MNWITLMPSTYWTSSEWISSLIWTDMIWALSAASVVTTVEQAGHCIISSTFTLYFISLYRFFMSLCFSWYCSIWTCRSGCGESQNQTLTCLKWPRVGIFHFKSECQSCTNKCCQNRKKCNWSHVSSQSGKTESYLLKLNSLREN